MIQIDGSMGEGGGQVFRTTISFAALLKKTVQIKNIRKHRKKPGLRIQHLTALRAMVKVTGGEVMGDYVGSSEVIFIPGETNGGCYTFDVSETSGSAGSVSLIFQALLLPLLFAQSSSTLELIGGTHVPLSPPYHYLERVFLPTLRRMGVSVDISLLQWGWYPMGKGKMKISIHPVNKLHPLQIDRKRPLRQIYGISASSNLPAHIRLRQKEEALRLLSEQDTRASFEEVDAYAFGKGSFVFLYTDPEDAVAGFSAVGAVGKSAENVAREAWKGFNAFFHASSPCDPFIADQLVPYLALAAGESFIRFSRLSFHLSTHVGLLGQFLPKVKMILEGKKDGEGSLQVSGMELQREDRK
jgi:RNA 3'-phosphate cyclase